MADHRERVARVGGGCPNAGWLNRGARLLAFDPAFSIQGWAATVGMEPATRRQVSKALRLAGLPE